MRGGLSGDGAMKRIAFVTFGPAPDMTADDALAAAALEEQAVRVVSVPWDSRDMDWSQLDAVVIRSTWDYHRRCDDFCVWAERVEAAGTPLWNPAAVVRWNADKRYLRDLERAGVSVVPTEWIRRGSRADLRAVLERRGWQRAVVKPSVSATGYRTSLIDGDGVDEHAPALAALLEDADALVQPFLPQVQREGEWSFVFFAGGDGELAFSHAVLKRPAPGDFRVQVEYGGSHTGATPPARLRRQVEMIARQVACVAPGPLLYARLDGVVASDAGAGMGGFMLMEAELIEPALFLACADGAARFARAIAAA